MCLFLLLLQATDSSLLSEIQITVLVAVAEFVAFVYCFCQSEDQSVLSSCLDLVSYLSAPC